MGVKVLLTGATGFIGSAFLRGVLARGHVVAALARQDTTVVQSCKHQNLQWLPGTITSAPWEQIQAFGAEACVHCAWTTAPRVAYDSPEHLQFFKKSEDFLNRVIDSGIEHMIGIGTCIEYQLGNAPLVEDKTPIGPVGPYAQSKNNMRIWLEQASGRRGFQFCWSRIFYVYGPGEDPTRLCSSLIRRFRGNEPLILKTPNSTKDYVYIEDVADALLLLLETKFPGAVNIGTGIGVTILELAEMVATLLGKTGLVQTAAKVESDPLGYVVADATRLRSLGWKPRYDLKQGIKAMIAAQTPEHT